MKRINLLKLGKDALEAIKVPFKVKKDKKALERWIIEKEELEATLQYDITELKGNSDFNPDSILDKEDDLALCIRRLKQGEELLKELF